MASLKQIAAQIQQNVRDVNARTISWDEFGKRQNKAWKQREGNEPRDAQMSETKTTPGPWTMNDNKQTVSVGSSDSEFSICCLSIAAEQQRSPRVARANARLIASAPELADALETVARFLRGEMLADAIVNVSDDPAKHYTLAEFIRAALAKAGRTP